MECHLDRKIILSEESEFKGLYRWFLRELGNEGETLARDQIPWAWTLWFELSEISLVSSLELDRFSKPDSSGKFGMRESIRATLEPLGRQKHGTTYFMFGTDREISDLKLHVYQVGAGEEEQCSAWGCVSYTADVDFSNVTSDDTVVFSIHVNEALFRHLAQRITEKSLVRGTFKVGNVAGFYSDWSPGISTSRIKVLTSDTSGQPVEIPEGCTIVPPRLDKIGEFELSLVSETKFQVGPAARLGDDNQEDEVDEWPSLPSETASSQFLPIADATTTKVLKSLRLATWIIAALLLVIIVK